jgi:hypothetical protein
MLPLLKKAIADEAQKTGVASWFDRLPKKQQDALAQVRKEFWDEGQPCKMSALYRTCHAEFGLKVKQGAFTEWLNRGKPE